MYMSVCVCVCVCVCMLSFNSGQYEYAFLIAPIGPWFSISPNVNASWMPLPSFTRYQAKHQIVSLCLCMVGMLAITMQKTF